MPPQQPIQTATPPALPRHTGRTTMLVLLLLILVAAGASFATAYVLGRAAVAPSATLPTATPQVHIGKPEAVMYESGLGGATVECASSQCAARFPDGTLALPLPAALPEFLSEPGRYDTIGYDWVQKRGLYTYTSVSGSSIMPGGADSVTALYVWDPTTKTLKNVFKCFPGDDCVQIGKYIPIFFQSTSTPQGIDIYRDFIAGGVLHSSVAASIPLSEWNLGTSCSGVPCQSGGDWITVLDDRTFVLRFTKLAPSGSSESLTTKYVLVSLE